MGALDSPVEPHDNDVGVLARLGDIRADVTRLGGCGTGRGRPCVKACRANVGVPEQRDTQSTNTNDHRPSRLGKGRTTPD